ncbi:MAG: T9SS type A sorting domain-containing protein [Candidatus Cloacimonetes bacterium]|nr:T9SS type A sorting domain-containing protein [Candidatus Cloacimonadota bacterium]
MKKIIVCFLIVVLTISVFSESNSLKMPQEITQRTSTRLVREREIFFEEGFEEGQGDWTFVDETVPINWEEWHLTTTEAYEGYSWWMGDEELGGYNSHRYIVLDTPILNIPTTGYELSFKLAWSVEAPGGEPADYDGWDGCNVEVSTDDGSTFTAIAGTPAYNAFSLYSFGDEFHEGVGIPGWTGDSNGFQDASFDLSNFSNQDIIVRFAFCSDPAYDTSDNAAMFGMVIDNILISDGFTTLFESDGEGASGDALFVPGFGCNLSGNFWEITTDNPHNESNVAHCQVMPNLENSVISPLISIPDDIYEAFIDYYVYCDVPDVYGGGDETMGDFYMVFVKGENETNWTRLHYNFSGTEIGGVAAEWTMIDQVYALEVMGWQEGTCDISDWIGQNIQLKFHLKTDDNDDGGIGSGLFIDDVRAYIEYYIPPPPENVQATTNDDNTVTVSWFAPGSTPPDPGWYSYFDELSHLSWAGPERATKFDLSEIATFYISGVKHLFYEHSSFPWGADTTFKFKIYDGAGENVLYESDIMDALQYPNETEISFDPVQVTGSFYLSIAPMNSETGMPSSAGNESSSSHSYNGSAGSWESNDIEWASFVYVTDQYGKAVNFEKQSTSTRDIIGYNIYHSAVSDGNFDLIGNTDATTYEFIHMNPIIGAYNYYIVRSVFVDGESSCSQEARTFVEPDMDEMVNDDGSCEGTFDVSIFDIVLSRYEVDGEGTINYFKYYVNEHGTGPAFVRIYLEGDNGLPEQNPIFTAVVSENDISTGWNYLAINPIITISESDNYIFAGIINMSNSPEYGIDTDTQGQTYVGISSNNMAVSEDGNAMFRLLGNGVGVGLDKNVITHEKCSVSIYPNPFNPTTNISFSITKNNTPVEIKIYNVKGELVKTFNKITYVSGLHSVKWNGFDNNNKAVSSGVYFSQIIIGAHQYNDKMILLK